MAYLEPLDFMTPSLRAMKQEPQITEEHHEQEIALIPGSQPLSSVYPLLWPMIFSVMTPKSRRICQRQAFKRETCHFQAPHALMGAETMGKQGAVVIHACHAVPQPLAMMRPWRFPVLAAVAPALLEEQIELRHHETSILPSKSMAFSQDLKDFHGKYRWSASIRVPFKGLE